MSAGGSSLPGTGANPGSRRIDRVLAGDYLDGLRSVELAEVRGLRDEAEQEEVDLSYVRRLIQGRMDIVRAELNRREGPVQGSLVESLARVLADEPRSDAYGGGRHSTIEPSRIDSHRRYVEALVADTDLSDTSARSTDELHHALRVLSDEEQVISAKRRQVQSVMDAGNAEIARRYRDGEADVSAVLADAEAKHLQGPPGE